jgi:hypothetical protein
MVAAMTEGTKSVQTINNRMVRELLVNKNNGLQHEPFSVNTQVNTLPAVLG